MSLKAITQTEFDSFEISQYGVKQCPTGDYSQVKITGLCSFGESCKCEEKYELMTGYPALGFWGAGSSNRGVIAWNTKDGILIRCGCFLGLVDKFREQVIKTHSGTKHELIYLGFANLACAQFDRNDLLDFQS